MIDHLAEINGIGKAIVIEITPRGGTIRILRVGTAEEYDVDHERKID